MLIKKKNSPSKEFGQCHLSHSSTFWSLKPFSSPGSLVMCPLSHSASCYLTEWNEIHCWQQLIITVTGGLTQIYTHLHTLMHTFTWRHTHKNWDDAIPEFSLQPSFYCSISPTVSLICFNATYSDHTLKSLICCLNLKSDDTIIIKCMIYICSTCKVHLHCELTLYK